VIDQKKLQILLINYIFKFKYFVCNTATMTDLA